MNKKVASPVPTSLFSLATQCRTRALKGIQTVGLMPVLDTLRYAILSATQNTDSFLESKTCGGVNLSQMCIQHAIVMRLADVESIVAPTRFTGLLARIYDILADKDVALTSEKSENRKANLIQATAWQLYCAPLTIKDKLSSNPTVLAYYYLVGLLTHNIGFAIDEGQFEYFVNTESSQDSDAQSKILRNVNAVVHNYDGTAYATLAGSRNKHTNVDRMSDIDIWVKCESEIDELMREDISNKIVNKLQADFPGLMIRQYHTNATSFMWPDDSTVEFDIVFEKTSFSPEVCHPPNRINFINKPWRQRAVKAFKLLQRDAPDQFSPAIASGAIEAFVISVDEAKGSMDSTSGVHLFLQCLYDLCHLPIDPRNKPMSGSWSGAARAICNRQQRNSPVDVMEILRNMGISYVAVR